MVRQFKLRPFHLLLKVAERVGDVVRVGHEAVAILTALASSHHLLLLQSLLLLHKSLLDGAVQAELKRL